MARVTTESCLRHGNIENRFELVLLASFRARCIESGSALGLADSGESDLPLSKEPRKDSILPVDYASGEKSVVLALREIERGVVNIDLVRGLLSKKSSPAELAPEKDVNETASEVSEEFSGDLSEQMSAEALSEDEAFYVSDEFEESGSEDEDLELD